VNPQIDPRFTQVSPFGVPVNYGLQHTGIVPQGWPMNVSPLGVQQMGIPQVGFPQVGFPQVGFPQVGMNYGWQTGLQHAPFVPTHVPNAFGYQVPVAQWPVQGGVGFGLNPLVQQNML
jgi:hypothetical protein